jgi:transcription elongation factor Elf1
VRRDDDESGVHFQCPFCNSYDVDRLYVGAVNVDSCACAACGSRWDEECSRERSRYRARSDSILMTDTRPGAPRR